MESIELPFFDLRYDKKKQLLQHRLELHPQYLKLVLEVYIDAHPLPDSDQILVEIDRYLNQTDYFLKHTITNICVWFDSKNENWLLDIKCGSGGHEDIKFQTENEVRIVEQKLINWLLND